MGSKVFYIAVCDDDESDRNQIREMTEEVCQQEHIRADLTCFTSARELLEAMENGMCYNLLMLDVMMPDKDGMDLARELCSKKADTSIIFISYNREMAMVGYEVSALRFLGKPLDREKLREALTFCYKKTESEGEILVPIHGGMMKIRPEEIRYIEISGRKSKIYLENEIFDTVLSLRVLEGMLSEYGFMRCHQSFLVNYRYVKSFRTSSLELSDGKVIPVSKHRIKEVRRDFFEYLKY